MSDADQPERAWRHYVKDMIEFSERIVSDTDGLNRNQFVADTLTYLAVAVLISVPGCMQEAHMLTI